MGFSDAFLGRLTNGLGCIWDREGGLIVLHRLIAVALRISQSRQVQQTPGFGFGVRLQFENLTEKAIARLGVLLQHSHPR